MQGSGTFSVEAVFQTAIPRHGKVKHSKIFRIFYWGTCNTKQYNDKIIFLFQALILANGGTFNQKTLYMIQVFYYDITI